MPGLDRFRWEVSGATDLAGCRQESIQAGEPDHLIMGAGSQDAVEAGLLGAGVTRRHGVIGQDGNEPIGGGELALGGFPFAPERKPPRGTQVSRASVPVFTKCDGSF